MSAGSMEEEKHPYLQTERFVYVHNIPLLFLFSVEHFVYFVVIVVFCFRQIWKMSFLFKELEAELAAKRAARAKSKEIRLKELKKQQKEVGHI